MTRYAGQFGKVRAFNDFIAPQGDLTWGTGVVELGGGWAFVSVNEGTVNDVTDESGGVLQFLTDTGDNDNVCLLAGLFDPSEGGCVMEARFKVADDVANTALFAGFSETLSLATPVMPAEFATATMTYNGSGGLVGMQWDSDATTNDWRACAGDGGAASGGAGNGTRANDAAVADDYDLVRVEIDGGSGDARCYLNGTLVDTFEACVTTTDLFYAVLMCENRTGAALELEVDYVYAEGGRDWDDQ